MFEKSIVSLAAACWLAAGAANAAFAESGVAGKPIPFEFGPDWRWVPQPGLSPPDGPGRDAPGRDAGEPGARVPSTGVPSARPEATRPEEKSPSEALRRAEAARRAMAPPPDPAVLRRENLAALQARLATEQNSEAAKRLATTIETVWLQSGSETADLLMQRAQAALDGKQVPLALALLDKIVVLEPGWSEARNRRAAARFQAGDTDGAMADIDQVLKLEPRHFGALVLMGTILEQAGLAPRALEVFRRALAVFPSQPSLQDHIERLETRVEGRGI
jgi:tetratricopeptide (TPR) repeat protein